MVPQGAVGRVQSRHQQQARRRAVQGLQIEVRAILAQAADQLPDVPGPDAGAPLALGLGPVVGEDVVDDDQRVRRRHPLGVHEVAQQVFEQVHAVEEDQVRRRLQVLAGDREEVVAGALDHPGALRQFDVDHRLRIHAHSRAGRQGEAGAGLHPDLEIGPRLQQVVDVLEHLVGGAVARHDLFFGRPVRGRRRLRLGQRRIAGRRQAGFGQDMAGEHPHQVVPRPALVAPHLHQAAVGVSGQGPVGVGIEAVAVDRMAMDGPRRRCDQEQVAAGPQHPDHLGEGQPEELAVLQHLARQHHVHRRIIQRQLVGVFQDDGDLGPVDQVGRQVLEPGIVEDRPIAAVDVGAADVEHGHRLLGLQGPAADIAAVAFVHVFKRRGVHRRSLRYRSQPAGLAAPARAPQ